jgi:hypothetical protein
LLGAQLLLKVIDTVVVPAMSAPFVARDKFVVGDTIFWLSSNFQGWFFNKVEESVLEKSLRYSRLLRHSVDGSILAELGDTAESMLDQVYSLIECQPNGEEGVLLTNGWANIFYVRDANGELRAVSVRRYDDGWNVDARSVEASFAWFGDSHVLSRNSLET